MKLNEIVAIAGIGGLHKIIGKTKNGLILESLTEPKKRFPTSIQDRVSVLDDIAMYTQEGDMRLAQVLVKLNEAEKSGKAIPAGKDDNKTQRNFLVETIQLDSERVYDSDVKKLLVWYAALKDILDFSTLLEEDASASSADETTEEVAEKAKPKAKKAKAETADEEVKPKKTAAKKTTTKTAAPKNVVPKTNTKGTGNTNTYRPKSV